MALVRRLWSLVLVVLLLAGCSQTAKKTAPSGPDRIGLCVRNYADASEYYGQLKAGLEGLGYAVVLEDSHNDQSSQDQKVQALIQKDCVLLVVEPVMTTALDTVVSAAKNEKLPVILLDRQPDQAVLDSYEGLYYVGCRKENAGSAQGALLEKLNLQGDLNEDGLVSCVVLTGPEDDLDAKLIADGCLQTLYGASTDVLSVVACQWSLGDGRAKCAQVLREFGPDLEVILCSDPQLALGAVEAVSNSGRNPGQDVYILAVGFDGQLERALSQGKVSGTVWVNPHDHAQLLNQTVEAVLADQPVEKISYSDYTPYLPQ